MEMNFFGKRAIKYLLLSVGMTIMSCHSKPKMLPASFIEFDPERDTNQSKSNFPTSIDTNDEYSEYSIDYFKKNMSSKIYHEATYTNHNNKIVQTILLL